MIARTKNGQPPETLKPPVMELSIYTLSIDGAHRFQIKKSQQDKKYAVVHLDMIYDDKYRNSEHSSPIDIHLIKQKEGWRIFDFRAPDHKESGRAPSLRNMLKQYALRNANCSPN